MRAGPELNDDGELSGVSGGRRALLSNLTSLLETGGPLPREPWRVPAP
ncbi:hypothetical protein [Streptomyces cellulosae]|nr:hypothetical protein [Streptomyces cellulosae]